jgi:hypothetical protein
MRINKSDSSFIVKVLRNVVLILLLIVFGSIIFNFRNKQAPTTVALMSEAVASKEFRGVFIRDEEVRTYSGNGAVSYKVADGGKLGTDTVIAEVYSSDDQISRNRDISALERELELLKKIQNPGTLESAQPASLSENIEESYRSMIYSRDMRDYDTLKSNVEDLQIMMSTYQIITKRVTGFNQQIADINTKLAELKGASVKPTEIIKSPRSAYFVSFCDGYESVLTPDKLDELTIADLISIEDRKSEDPKIIGKLVDGYGWYLAGVIDNTRKEYAIGDSVKIRFDSSSDMFDAVIHDVRNEGNPAKSIIILKCDQFNYELVQHRVEKCELIKLVKGKSVFHGLKVPRKAIRFMDPKDETSDGNEGKDEEPASTGSDITEAAANYKGIKGVYILKGEQITFKKIDVIYEGSDYILSEVHDDDSSYLALYDDILIEGVDADD